MTPLETAVESAVRELVALHGPMGAEAAHAALWPYVKAAAGPYAPRAAAPLPKETRDRRAKVWQYTVKFWDEAGELVAETDPERMDGTGAVPETLAGLARQLHGYVPDDLRPHETRLRLPQLRNNLGRAQRASLRVKYTDNSGAAFVCQMDIHRLEG